MIIKLYTISFQLNTTGGVTQIEVTGLAPFTTYICTAHAVTVSDGPMTDPMRVTTAQQGLVNSILYLIMV